MAEESFKRKPATEVSIEKAKESRGRLALIASLAKADKGTGETVLEDKGANIAATFPGDQLKTLEKGMTVRAIGKMSHDTEVFEGETITELKGFDYNLFERVKKVEKEFYEG